MRKSTANAGAKPLTNDCKTILQLWSCSNCRKPQIMFENQLKQIDRNKYRQTSIRFAANLATSHSIHRSDDKPRSVLIWFDRSLCFCALKIIYLNGMISKVLVCFTDMVKLWDLTLFPIWLVVFSLSAGASLYFMDDNKD